MPSLLGLATIGLLIEQQLFAMNSILWQLHPFIFILLILVAWQYSFHYVVVFTLLTAFINGVLWVIFPIPEIATLPVAGSEWMLTYALLFSRSVAFLLLGYVMTAPGERSTPTTSGVGRGQPEIGKPCGNPGAAHH